MTDLTLTEFIFESKMNYTFIEEIGRGGMGIVYLASRNSGGVVDYVVLKTLKTLTEEDEKSLYQEANLAAQLRHENIVKTYGLESIPLSALPEPFLNSLGALSYVKSKDQSRKKLRRINFKRKEAQQIEQLETSREGEKKLLLMVMDYIDGINLNSFHHEHVYQSLLIPVPLGAFVISRIARALSYSHNYLIHRDISPENILINTQGICKLSDFGIAVATRQQPDYWAGKLAYMAPEQLFNQPIDERIDLFSLGSVAYQILTGIPLIQVDPYESFEEQIGSVKKQFSDGIVPPCEVRSDIPKELSNIIMKMLFMNPNKRYQRASSVANDLEKEYLYAKGYGPTNNSLSTYMTIFENRFAMYNEEQLDQLSFLSNSNGEIQIKRQLDVEGYTREGMKLLEKRKDSEIYRQIQAQSRMKEISTAQREKRSPFLKVKYLDNVIESFMITESPITVGSGNDTVFLEEGGILPRHVTLIKSSSGNPLLKCISRDHPVNINENEETQKELREGDKVKLGSYVMFFIKQSAYQESSQGSTFTLDERLDLKEIAMGTNYTLKLSPNPQTFTLMARLVDQILASTNLGELKLGIIPTSFVEALQLLKTEETSIFVKILKTPVRLIFNCKGFTEEGYLKLIGNFRKHRQRLIQEIANAENVISGESQGFSLEEDLLSSTVASKKEFFKKEEKPKEESDEFDFDMEDVDPSMLAATLIVHAFDRIEFKKQSNEVEFVVYL